jgi:hypothetical protein
VDGRLANAGSDNHASSFSGSWARERVSRKADVVGSAVGRRRGDSYLAAAEMGPYKRQAAFENAACRQVLRFQSLPARFGAPTAVSATAESARGRLRTRFVDGQITTTKVVIVELANRVLGFLVRGHLDEREPARAAGIHVAHQIHAFDGADAREQAVKILIACVVREVANVKLLSHL